MKHLKRYLLLVFLFSAPLWLMGGFFDATTILPVNLPVSALQFFSVLLAAVLVTQRNGGSVRELLKRGIDFSRIKAPRWRFGVFLLMPLAVMLSYGLMCLGGVMTAAEMTPLLSTPVFLLIYGLSGYCEQLGWTAIMTDALLARYTLVQAGLLTGITWALWHIVPFIQTHHTVNWIVWQCVLSIIFRVLMTKIYVVTNRSLFGSVALHATYNTAFSLLPYYGSSYQPMYMAIATLITLVVVFIGEDYMHRSPLNRV